jgi:hypothetical protein
MHGNTFIVTYQFDRIPTAGLEQEHLVIIPEHRFHRTRALNTGARKAREIDDPVYFLFIDADVLITRPSVFVQSSQLHEPFPDYVLDSPYAFGSHRHRLPMDNDPDLRQRGLRGTHWVKSDFFFEVGGFNQGLRDWGFDDIDLYGRYADRSDRVTYYDRSALHHQRHDDKARTALQEVSLRESVTRNRTLSLSGEAVLHGVDIETLGYPEVRLQAPTRGRMRR